MKYITALLFTLLFAGKNAVAQSTSVGMSQEFKQLEVTTMAKRGFSNLQAYKNNEVNGSPYYYNDWVSGSVKTKNNTDLNSEYVFLYDKLEQQLYVKLKNSDVIFLADRSQVTSFELDNAERHAFINGSIIDKSQANNYLEILDQGSKYTLLKLNKTRYVRASNQNLAQVSERDFADKYVSDLQYFIVQNNELVDIKLNKRNLEKVFPENKADIEKVYEKKDKIDEAGLTEVVKLLNTK